MKSGIGISTPYESLTFGRRDHRYLSVTRNPEFLRSEFCIRRQPLFTQNALVWTEGKDAKKAVPQWLALPGYRDALLDQNIDTIGVHVDGDVAVLDASRGLAPIAKWRTSLFPIPDKSGKASKASAAAMPVSVPVPALGPEVEARLAERGYASRTEVGGPLTLHLYGGGAADVRCEVTARGEVVAGALERGGGTCRRTSAPGLWTFYPFEPLPRGVEITATWHVRSELVEVTFTVD
jgi:hypothetical protein